MAGELPGAPNALRASAHRAPLRRQPAGRRPWMAALAWGALAVASSSSVHGADAMSLERQRSVLHDALDAYDQAVAAESAPDSQAHYRSAAAGFESLVTAGVRSAAIEYNLGNAFFRLGDLGRAITHYRRAQRIHPADNKLAANLAYARARVEPAIRPSGDRRLAQRLLFWNASTSMNLRFWICALSSAAGWLGLAFWLRFRKGPLLALSLSAIGLGGANAGSVAWQLRDEQARPAAVLVAPETILRQGRGDAYERAMRQPLGAGVELRIIGQRGDWVEVELADETTGWLPAGALERV